MSARTGSRRYSILITRIGSDSDATPETGTWHSVTAGSLSEVLRAVRSGSLSEAVGAAYEPGRTRVDAVECLALS